MKNRQFILLATIILSAWNTSSLYGQKRSAPFGVGEEMEFKIHYGFVNAANATMKIEPKYEEIYGKKCYHIQIEGVTVGMFDLFMRVRDKFGSYIDKDLLVPRKSYRILEENKYRKHEIIDFDVENSKATVRNYDDEKEVWKKLEEFETYHNAQDIVSGYYYLRTLDFDRYAKGDTIDMKVFFDDENSIFKVLYLGRESVRTKLGKYNSIVLSPIMPKNKLFDGTSAIKVWISDDSDKIPLKVKAKMFIGAIEIDIKKYKRGVK